jgi:hypothetical protein
MRRWSARWPVVLTNGSKNRPPIKPRKAGILFHDVGPTGWGRKRDVTQHKGSRSEHHFEDTQTR